MRFQILFAILLTMAFTDLMAQCGNPDASVWENTWQSCEVRQNPNADRGVGHWIQYDFGSVYKLAKTRIWNSNEDGKTNIGFRNVIVDYSLNGTEWSELGTYELTQGTGEPVYSGFEGFDFEGKEARYVLITAIDNWGHADCYGLAEIKFNLAAQLQDSLITQPCTDPPCDTVCLAPEFTKSFVMNAYEVLLLWDEADLAQTYTIRYRPVGGQWQTLTSDETELFLEDLNPNQEYEYQILSNCAEGESEYSESFYFTTIEEQEECILPVISDWTILHEEVLVISWNEVPGSEGYRTRYRVLGSGDDWTVVEGFENFIEIEGLNFELTYEYQISVKCGDTWTAFSNSYLTNEDETTSANNLHGQENFEFSLFPNPASKTITLQIKLAKGGSVDIQVNNLLGEQVYLNTYQLTRGKQQLRFDLKYMESGVYFVSIIDKSNLRRQTRRLVVVKD